MNNDVTWYSLPRVWIRSHVGYDNAWERVRRAHWCVYQPAPPRVAWWAVQRVALATNAPQVIKFDGLELRSGDTFTLPQVKEKLWKRL